MTKKCTFFILFLTVVSFQSNAQTIERLKEINKVWDKFYQAFETLDYTLMAEIHSKKLVRVSGNKQILDYETYINNYKTGFQEDKNKNNSSTISLRFQERITNESTASERGIYKLTLTDKDNKSRSFYGKFHAIMQKEDGEWKILVDYDSNEGNTIGENDFNNAFAKDNLEVFIPKQKVRKNP